MDIPTLETARLRLRPFQSSDADRYFEIIYNDPEVMKTLPGGKPRPRESVDEAFKVFQNHWNMYQLGLWAVTLKESDTLIGHGGLLRFLADGESELEIAYGFGKAYWRQGYGTEVALESLRYGFEELKNEPEQILAVAVPENKGSFKVMEKCGMRFWKNVNSYNMTLPCYRITRAEYEARI